MRGEMDAAAGLLMVSAAASGSMLDPDPGYAPDWLAVLRYGGYGAAVGVVGAMWSERARGFYGFMRLVVSAFVIGGGVGAAFAEWRGQPTVALAATLVISLFLPALMTDGEGTVQALVNVWKDIRNAGGARK